jgi:hypothetical protein
MHFKELYMRHLPWVIAVLSIIFFSCKAGDDFQFGVKYNSIRQRWGSPLIKHNMKANKCCGLWTEYKIGEVPDDDKAYHFSKTIRAITNNRLTNEKDIFRENLDDTTILQLNLLTLWIWADNKLNITGNFGKIDRRTLDLRAKDFITDNAKYPSYDFKELDEPQIDSLLHSWGLSRFDKE